MWHLIRIADFGTVITGKTPSSKDPEHFGEIYPFITPTDIDTNRIVATERRISEEGSIKFKRQMLPRNSVCFVCIGATIGKICRTMERSLTNQQINSIVVDKTKHDPFFVYYLLSTYTEKVKSVAGGAATPIVNKTAFENIEAIAPPLSTQHKIASILSPYDDLIENNLRRIKILEDMAQSLYREWFVKFRFPGHEKVRMVDFPLGEIPEGWEVVPLEDVCSRITDGAHRSPKTVDIGYPMASVKDMHDWGINVDTCRKISEEEFKNLVHNDCKMLKNDVLIAKDGSYLKHCFVVEKDIDVSLLSSIAMLRPNERIRPHVLAMTLKDSNIKTRMKGYVSGAALPRIILKEFRKFEIVLPPFDLQKEWAGYAEPMIELCLRLIKKNTTLRRTRNLLLPKLISGELDVSDLDIKTGGPIQ